MSVFKSMKCKVPNPKTKSLVSIRNKKYEKMFHIRTDSTSVSSLEDSDSDDADISSSDSESESGTTYSDSFTESSSASEHTSSRADSGVGDLIQQAVGMLRGKSHFKLRSCCKSNFGKQSRTSYVNDLQKVQPVSPTVSETACSEWRYSSRFSGDSYGSTAVDSSIPDTFQMLNVNVRESRRYSNDSKLKDSHTDTEKDLTNNSFKQIHPQRLTNSIRDTSHKNCSDVNRMSNLQCNKRNNHTHSQSNLASQDLFKSTNQNSLFVFYHRADVEDVVEDEIQEMIQHHDEDHQEDGDTVQLFTDCCSHETGSDRRVYKRIVVTKVR